MGRDEKENLAQSLRDILNEVAEEMDRPKAPRWIPVTERLPEVGKKVLVHTNGGKVLISSLRKCFLKDDDLGFVTWSAYTKPVTHWMPLPEPPEKEGEADGKPV